MNDAKELFDKVNKVVMDALKKQSEYERSPLRYFDIQYRLDNDKVVLHYHCPTCNFAVHIHLLQEGG